MPQVLYWRDNLPAQRPYLSVTELAPPRHCIGRESTALLGLRLLDVLIGRMQLSLTARSLDGSVCCFGLKAFGSQCHGNARLVCSWWAFPMWSNLFISERRNLSLHPLDSELLHPNSPKSLLCKIFLLVPPSSSHHYLYYLLVLPTS